MDEKLKFTAPTKDVEEMLAKLRGTRGDADDQALGEADVPPAVTNEAAEQLNPIPKGPKSGGGS